MCTLFCWIPSFLHVWHEALINCWSSARAATASDRMDSSSLYVRRTGFRRGLEQTKSSSELRLLRRGCFFLIGFFRGLEELQQDEDVCLWAASSVVLVLLLLLHEWWVAVEAPVLPQDSLVQAFPCHRHCKDKDFLRVMLSSSSSSSSFLGRDFDFTCLSLLNLRRRRRR